MIQMGSLEKPVRKVRDVRLFDFEHGGLRDIWTVCRDQVILLRLDLEEMTER